VIRAGIALSLPGIQRKGSEDENQGTARRNPMASEPIRDRVCNEM
jgi:hypothetical protein